MKRKNVLLFGFLLVSVILLSAGLATAAQPPLLFDDMEHGNPFGNGWFTFNGAGGGGIAANTADLPPVQGGVYSLETGWGGGGPGFFGGFGRTYPLDLTGTTHFTFWINPDAGQDYTLEINLQEDDNGDDAIAQADDDEYQYNCTISAAGPCAIAGGGWQMVSIPLDSFFRDASYLYGGNGVFDPVPVSNGGNGQLINVVMAVISNSGADANFRTDNWMFAGLIVDDFENGLPAGVDGDGNDIGFYKFEGPGAAVSFSATNVPPVQVPGASAANNVFQLDSNVPSGSWGGVIHAFENEALDTWTPQNWSRYEGISFWLYGNNTGSTLFIDVLDNRAPDSTGDTAERFSFDIIDDFSGWQLIEIPFTTMNRKEVDNDAPNDGFTLTEVHGWAFGVFDAGQPFTNYIDDVQLYGAGEPPPLEVAFAANETKVIEGSTAGVLVKLTRALGDDTGDPLSVSVSYHTEAGSAVAGRDYTPKTGTLTFVQGGPSEMTIPIETFDDPKHDGDKTVILRLTNPVDIAPGFVMQTTLAILDKDPLDATLIDDFERGPYLWQGHNVILNTPEIAAGDPLAVPSQGDYEHILEVTTAVVVDVVIDGAVCNNGNGIIPLAIVSTDDFDALSIDHNTVRFGDAAETHRDNKSGEAQRHEEDFDGDGKLDLVFHFRAGETGYACDSAEFTLTGETVSGQPIVYGDSAGFSRDFALHQDWSGAEALSFWFYGTNSGDDVTLQLKDNRAPDPGPAGWNMVWSDEFDEPAGTPPNPAYWSYEIGDGAANRNPGWGNGELQYYTDSTANSATDGSGNLVITAEEADGSLACYYGPCEYTSARLISQYKAEFAYGRIESRIQVPDGEDGLWPAFWSLGTDIPEVGWPQTGEIDFMEYVSRLSNEIFGTIHGPGYSGGKAVGNTHDFGEPVSNDFHTFTIEWEPGLIRWYVDGIHYHTATPGDVAPNEWVFNDPVFLIFNMAIGGNFGGEVSDQLTFPQEMKIDYVRVYQGPDTAERWEATFADDFDGWQRVVVPFDSLTRSAQQPDGAPNDGLGLAEVWGYSFELPEGAFSDTLLRLDEVRLELITLTVTNTNDGGEGSLRQALQDIPAGSTIYFDPALAGDTIVLTSGPLAINRNVTIDGSAAPGLTVSGNSTSRVFEIGAGVYAAINNLTIAGGSADTGAGIHISDGGSLALLDSTVIGNSASGDGGGLLARPGTTVHIERSTFSGNTGGVGGALRTFGNATVINSTLSGNVATGWWGGAIFHTDGVMDIISSTITDNVGPGLAPSAIFVGSWAPSQTSTLNLTGSIVADNEWIGCYAHAEGGGTPVLASGGYNVASDATCNLTAVGDQPNTDPMIDPLADNGGPTFTHVLQVGSPAIDSGDNAVCPATDQRGFARDAFCDIGAYEFIP